ncbi:hypothetical protein LY76DRAFT_685508 [Colletotrichum caudatum]|nr:hypothetical protein LY76DRAFT_685508 [Colletotrichum caudatum]
MSPAGQGEHDRKSKNGRRETQHGDSVWHSLIQLSLSDGLDPSRHAAGWPGGSQSHPRRASRGTQCIRKCCRQRYGWRHPLGQGVSSRPLPRVEHTHTHARGPLVTLERFWRRISETPSPCRT